MADEVDFFLSLDERRDFALLIEGQKVYVNRDFLACWSSVFAKIFFPDGAAFKQPEGGMEMKGKKLDDFLTFLRFICPSPQFTKMKIDEENVASLLAYADEYDVGMLLERCAKFMGKQLKQEKVAGDGLVDYLRLASLYNLKDMQEELVPLVAQLAFCQIQAAHATLTAAVLAAVYQAKALQKAHCKECCCGCTWGEGELPDGAFECSECAKPCTISGGKSACCSEVVRVLSSVAAEALQPCSFVCGRCEKPCTLELADDDDGCYYTSCCEGSNVLVHPKCKHQSVGAAPGNVGFSADLLAK